MTERKIFGIGFHKTATSSLGAALSVLGYDVCGHIGVSRPNIAEVALELAISRVPKHDAFQDNPWPVLYRELDERYPNAKFILTTRPTPKWIESVVNQFGGQSTPMRKWIYGVGDPEGNEKIYIDRYERHNRNVKNHFSGRPEDFLELRITEGEGWEELCAFLGHSVPNQPFPRVNRAELRPVKKVFQNSPSWVQRILRTTWHHVKGPLV